MFAFFRDLAAEIAAAVRWFFSPHAWRIVLVVLPNLLLLSALSYVAIAHYEYGREAFTRCPGNRNLLFMSQFFASIFFALFAVATIGETINWVDEKRSGRPTPSVRGIAIYSTLTAVCGATALFLIMQCS